MISGDTPKHLVVAARTGFLSALRGKTYNWQRVAMLHNLTAKREDLVDLGAAPMPTNSKTGTTMQDFVEKTKSVTPTDWDITVWISQNALSDDQTGTLDGRVRSAGDRFQQHINNRVFTVLNAGDGQTYGSSYDGQDFFVTDHIDKGGAYQTAQDNVSALALSLDNFETVKVASNKFLDDRGEPVGYNYDTLIVAPELERIAAQICKNAEAYDTGNREANPYAGVTSYIVSPKFDSTAWVLAAGNESAKPILIGERKAPELQSAWFDPNGPEGGMNYFKFFARYVFAYGDWRLAHMGNS